MFRKIGSKGVGPIALAAVMIAVVLILEGVFVANLSMDAEVVKRSAREIGVIDAVNSMENSKRAISQSLEYSFHRASSDVLGRGGFCEYLGECDVGCMIPSEVPSEKCIPWWLFYDNVYAPEYYSESEKSFAGYLKNRTIDLFDEYSISFNGPKYCPSEYGNLIFGHGSAGGVSLSAMNLKGNPIQYENGNGVIVTERTSNFTAEVSTSAFDLFKHSHDMYVVNDKIRLDFINSDVEMKGILASVEIGDVCQTLSEDSACESILQNKLSRPAAEGDSCDYDRSGTVDADEVYKCMVEDKITERVISGNFVSTTEIDGCFNTGHTSKLTYSSQISEIDWLWYNTAKDVGGETFESVQDTCGALISACGGCSDMCVWGELGCGHEENCVVGTEGCNGVGTKWVCEANACGIECCQSVGPAYTGLKCEYDFFGSVNSIVTVADYVSAYPVGDSWSALSTKFRVTSGNMDCESIEPGESVEDSQCCQPEIDDPDAFSSCRIPKAQSSYSS